MKTTVLLFISFSYTAVLASTDQFRTTREVDGEFLSRQKKILDLLIGMGHKEAFKTRCEDFDLVENAGRFKNHHSESELVSVHETPVERTFSWVNGTPVQDDRHLQNSYKKFKKVPKLVSDFLSEYVNGLLPADQEFSLSNRKTLRQTIELFELLISAKDFDTFYETACWARKHVNEVQFAYVLYVTVLHRRDCRGMELPPWYDIFPNSFIPQEVMHKIYDAKMEGVQNLKVFVNNSGWEDFWQKKTFGSTNQRGFDAPFTHVEERISYFREDVGLNDYLAQLSVIYPPWLDSNKYLDVPYFRRGELFYYAMQQIFARYSMERMYNSMPKCDMLHWDQPIKIGYNPKVTSPGGELLYPRAFNMVPKDFNPAGVWEAEILERRIVDALDAGVIFYKSNSSFGKLPANEAVNAWGNAIWGTPEGSENGVYGNYFQSAVDAIAHIVRTGSEDEFVTGALGHQMTAARDPAFFMLLNRLMKIFQRLKDTLPAYTKKELAFPGVKINDMEVGPLTTFFDRFDFEATNGVPLGPNQDYRDFEYVGSQTRINHKPFTYKLKLESTEPTVAMVRIFIGPKTDAEERPLALEEARTSFVELDRFPIKLRSGKNLIERKSSEFTAFIGDKEGLTSLYHKNGMSIDETLTINNSLPCGLPQRLILPKGSLFGEPLVFQAVVSPYDRTVAHNSRRTMNTMCGGYYDGRAYGFPYDRRIDFEDLFNVPNIHSEETTIFHKDETDANRPEFV